MIKLNVLFSGIRSSFMGKQIRNIIREYPGYQHYPRNKRHWCQVKIRATLSLVSQIVTTDKSTKGKIKELKKLRNTRDNAVLLIGNGPSSSSLTKDQIAYFRYLGGSIAVMNSFYKSHLAQEIEPDYYFVVDPEHWEAKYISNITLRKELQNYLGTLLNPITIVQPAQFEDIGSMNCSYIYVDGRSSQGLWRRKRPDKPWGLPSSVSMVALATLDFLGHKPIFFSGLDSTFIKFFEIDDLNQVINHGIGQHFYPASTEISDIMEPIEERGKFRAPYRDLADLYYGHSVFLHDLDWLCKDKCINIGNDNGNQTSPRACLLPKPI